MKEAEKERQIPYDITYMWSLKSGTDDLPTKQKQITDLEIRLVFARGGGGREGDKEFGVGRCKHLEQVSNGALLYSTGNCAQCLGLEHDKDSVKKKKKRMCVYV